jgi:DNA processing protein
MPSADAYWLGLRKVRGVGPRTARLLIDKFGAPEKIFALGADQVAAAGITLKVARAIAEFRDFDQFERELCELPRLGARLVHFTDSDYPPNLRHIADPPTYLYVRGDARIDDPSCIAIVGARAASDAGRRMAQRLGLELAAKGFVVVSGLARGIDADAHQGALDAHGRTLAVMGCGVDVIYPPEHQKLADAIIASGGALVSELAIGAQPVAENFPPRNRILSGLCLGVVIVEAAERSGSLITARMALEQDRQVFAVPGSPLSGKTRGSNRLLKEGAVLVECVEDVVAELAPQLTGTGTSSERVTGPSSEPVEKVPANPATPAGKKSEESRRSAAPDEATIILKQLKADQRTHVDSLIESSGLNVQTVLRLLLELELCGQVTQHPGKLFSLV